MSEQDRLRVQREKKRDALMAMGVDPYGGLFPGVVSSAAVRQAAEPLQIAPGEHRQLQSRVAGRIALLRVMGKLAFITLRDEAGTIQLGLSRSALGEQWPLLKELDLGDIIGADGQVGRTQTGELTIWATALAMLAKSLRPPPEKWHGLTDVELRYRQRYVDLFANAEVRATFRRRSAVIQAIRECLLHLGYLEVETPVLQPIYGGAAARPFITHHNTLDRRLYLRISPELYLKRLLVGGMERVFEISRNFRNEGLSTKHNPEFTMIELYEAYADYTVMMERVEQMVCAAFDASARSQALERRDALRKEVERLRTEHGPEAAEDCAHRRRLAAYEEAADATARGRFTAVFQGEVLDFTPPWPRERYGDLFARYAGVAMGDVPGVRRRARQLGIEEEGRDDAVVINDVFEATVERHLIQPVFVYDYPAAICPLTKRHPQDPSIALRFEAFVAGMEIGNAYTELNDPAVQESNFKHRVAGEGDATMAVMDEDFITALEYGMPPAGGLGVGIDRLVMILTDSSSIRDVILFPLQRAKEAATMDLSISGAEGATDV